MPFLKWMDADAGFRKPIALSRVGGSRLIEISRDFLALGHIAQVEEPCCARMISLKLTVKPGRSACSLCCSPVALVPYSPSE